MLLYITALRIHGIAADEGRETKDAANFSALGQDEANDRKAFQKPASSYNKNNNLRALVPVVSSLSDAVDPMPEPCLRPFRLDVFQLL